MEQRTLEGFQTKKDSVVQRDGFGQNFPENAGGLPMLEIYFSAILDQTSDVIYRVSPHGYFSFANPAAVAKFGYSPEELTGKHFIELVHPDWRKEVGEFYEKCLEQRLLESRLGFVAVTKEGDALWLEQNVRLIYDDFGQLVEALAIARDLTEQKVKQAVNGILEACEAASSFTPHEKQTVNHLLRREEKYRNLMENLELGMLEMDNHGRIMRAYPFFCEMTGYEESELVGKKFNATFLPHEFQDVMKKQMHDRRQGKSGVFEIQMSKKDGSRIWAVVSGAPVYNEKGEVIGSIGVHYDVTSQRQLQQELFEARLRAEEAQEAEKQFLANMSHEIRTPLNAVIGMTHLLFDTLPSPEQSDYLDVLKSSADILQRLINDVLDFAKIRSGKLEVQPKEFDLAGLVGALGKIFRLKVEGKPVQVETQIDPSLDTLLLGDDLLLNQILLNLLGNAEKFTARGKIGVRAMPVGKENDRFVVRFEVFDTGVGISKDKQDLVFQSFRQADSDVKRRFGGTGLGLTIVKNLVELQGGKIWVESEEGEGSTFIFEIPYEATGKAVTATDGTAFLKKTGVAEGISVLVVEDNSMNRKYISTLLSKWGIAHKLAINGRKGFEMTQRERFDLIFLDIQMPEMDGYETATAIRNSINPNSQTPLIALTASAMLSKRERAIQSGMNDYVSKPFNPEQLAAVLNKYAPLAEMALPETAQPGEAKATFFEPVEPLPAPVLQLDRAYLEEIYGGDEAYAAEMFQLFFEKMSGEYQRLRPLLAKGELTLLSKLAHKLKPAFPMVGLTWLEPKFEKLENLALQEQVEREVLEREISDLEIQVKWALPLVEAEWERLRCEVEVLV